MLEISDSNENEMGTIKPSINPTGYRTAIKDYSEQSIIEEIAANSYDAYASTAIILLDDIANKLYVLDDGNGFDENAIKEMLTLGGGGKLYADPGERAYLGSYGYGLKAVIKIAKHIEIETCSKKDNKKYAAKIDESLFDRMMEKDSPGYDYDESDRPQELSKGTIITLSLKTPTTKKELDEFGIGLGNLPTDNGKFNCYYGFYRDAKDSIPAFFKNFTGLDEIAKKLLSSDKIKLASNVFDSELSDCEQKIIHDTDETSVSAKIYFAGMQGNKPKNLKESLRGVYVRVNDRLLKSNFSNDKYTGGISKYIMFKSAMRAEFSIDWLRSEITLSRDGIKFTNEKLEADFKKIVGRLISRFIKPKLLALEKSKEKAGNKKFKQRMELANKRVSKNKDAIIKGANSGFVFKPDTDAELAILIAQDYIMNKINKSYKLIDYNDKEPFDCMIYDESRTEFIQTELEPTLMEFLEHRNKAEVQLIITWTLGKWRLGAAKNSGKGGFFELIQLPNSLKGNYRILEFASESSPKPRKHYEVIVVEDLLK